MDARIMVLIAFAASALCIENADLDQKKRDAGKASPLNAIPSDNQKEYIYNTYTPNSNTQYQPQTLSSFYPNQATNQYYPQEQVYATPNAVNPQPQILPYNLVQNPSYSSKYQLYPSKAQNVLAIIQPNIPQSLAPFVSAFGAPVNQNPQSFFNHGQFGFPGFQSFVNPYQQPMIVLAQPNTLLQSGLAANLNSLGAYYQSSAQPKIAYNTAQTPNDYDKYQTPANQISKNENDISYASSEYVADTNANYKSVYPSSRNSYSKIAR